MNDFSPEYDIKYTNYTEEQIQEAIDNQSIIGCTVTKCSKQFKLMLKLGDNIEGYIEEQDLELFKSFNKQAAAISKVGKQVCVVPISIEHSENGVIVKCSRLKAQEQCYNNYTSKLVPGDIIRAVALKYETYGIFCDIGCGLIALLPTGKIRVPYILEPLKENRQLKELYAVVDKIHKDGKVELTHKELLGTWEDGLQSITKGEIRLGKVIGIQDYGYFIMISQSLHGLAEICENKDINLGDTVTVKVLHIAKNTKRIKLQVIDKVESQPIFEKYEYTQTSGHIDKWEYYENSGKVSYF